MNKELKTELASKIPGMFEKYSDNPAYPVRPFTQGEMFCNMVLDVYKWADLNNYEVKDTVCFPTGKGIEIVVLYYEL